MKQSHFYTNDNDEFARQFARQQQKWKDMRNEKYWVLGFFVFIPIITMVTVTLYYFLVL